MSQKTYALLAGVIFLVIAIAHLARVVFRVPVVVEEIDVPMWASAIAVIVMAFLAYEGFHLARKSPPKS